MDSPWVSGVDRHAFRASLEPLRRLDPEVVLCTHLPPARAAAAQLLDTLETAPDAGPFVGPDQAALEALVAGSSRRPAEESATPARAAKRAPRPARGVGRIA